VRIERIPLSKINPAPYNPREKLTPGDPAYEDIKTSLLAFGLVEPLVWNERSGNLVGGHQRLNILQAELDVAGLEQVDGEPAVPCSVVDLDEPHEKALNIRLNKTAGRWDYLSLAGVLDELSVTLDDIKLTGYDEAEAARVRILADPRELGGGRGAGAGDGYGGGDGADEPGRFIFVYQSNEEKEALAYKLGIDGAKVVYTIEDVKE